MRGKRFGYLALALIGIGLILAGIFAFPGEAQKRLAGLCYGIGAAAFGLGAAWFAGTFIPILQDKDAQRCKAIAVADERNVLIRDRAGAMTEKYTTYGLILWIAAAGLFLCDPACLLPPIILLVLRFAVLLHYTNRYMKEM